MSTDKQFSEPIRIPKRAFTAIRHPKKRVNIKAKVDILDQSGSVIQKAGTIMRTTRILASKLVATGKHVYTTKGKLKLAIKRGFAFK